MKTVIFNYFLNIIFLEISCVKNDFLTTSGDIYNFDVKLGTIVLSFKESGSLNGCHVEMRVDTKARINGEEARWGSGFFFVDKSLLRR